MRDVRSTITQTTLGNRLVDDRRNHARLRFTPQAYGYTVFCANSTVLSEALADPKISAGILLPSEPDLTTENTNSNETFTRRTFAPDQLEEQPLNPTHKEELSQFTTTAIPIVKAITTKIIGSNGFRLELETKPSEERFNGPIHADHGKRLIRAIRLAYGVNGTDFYSYGFDGKWHRLACAHPNAIAFLKGARLRDYGHKASAHATPALHGDRGVYMATSIEI